MFSQKPLEHTSNNKNKTHLSIEGKKLTRQEIASLKKHLEKYSFLEVLNIRRCEANKEQFLDLCHAIQSYHPLTQLDFSSNLLDSFCMETLHVIVQKNTSLHLLNLSFNNIGDKGLSAIIRALERSTCISILYLQKTGITYSGAVMLGNFLSKNNSLQKIFLGLNAITETGVKFIYQGVKNHNKLIVCSYDQSAINAPLIADIKNELEKNIFLSRLLLTPFSPTHVEKNISSVESTLKTPIEEKKEIVGYKALILSWLAFFAGYIKNDLLLFPLEIIEKIGSYVFQDIPIMHGKKTPFTEKESYNFTCKLVHSTCVGIEKSQKWAEKLQKEKHSENAYENNV